MSTITWSQIEAECGNYRDGFVATFRKYEGQDTDERDAQNRVVKVTVESFARHAGIPPTTFKRWVKTATSDVPTGLVGDRGQMETAIIRRAIRNAPPAEKAKLAAELIAEPEVAEQVVQDPESRVHVHKALDKQWSQTVPPRSFSQTAENPHEAESDSVRLLIKLRGADRALTDAAVLAQNIRGVSAKDAAMLEPVVERMRGLLDLISTGLNGGPLDVELRALLDAEAGS